MDYHCGCSIVCKKLKTRLLTKLNQITSHCKEENYVCKCRSQCGYFDALQFDVMVEFDYF